MLRAAAASISYTPILGAPQEGGSANTATPVAHLLSIDGVTFLLDAGWDASLNPASLKALEPILDRVDCVLLSSPSISHCGAIPYVYQRASRSTQIYAPMSTSRLGLFNFIGVFRSRHTDELAVPGVTTSDGSPFVLTIDNIHEGFKAVKEPRGGMAVISGGRGGAVSIEVNPIADGRVLGGMAWRLKHQTDDLLYLPGFGLQQSPFIKPFNIPTNCNILLSDLTPMTHVGESDAPVKKSVAQAAPPLLGQAAFDAITYSLRRDAIALLPVDAVDRGLEVLFRVAKKFEQEGLTYHVAFAHPKANELLQRAKTMAEQLVDGIFTDDKDPWDQGRVTAVTTAAEAAALDGPLCIVADGVDCETGIAGDLLSRLVSTENSLVLFTSSVPAPGTVGRALYDAGKATIGESTAPVRLPRQLNYNILRHHRLLGLELDEYEARKAEEEAKKRAKESHEEQEREDVKVVVDAVYDAEDSDEDDFTTDAAAGEASATEKLEGIMDVRFGSTTTANLFLPTHLKFKSKHLTFPLVESTAAKTVAKIRREAGNPSALQDCLFGTPMEEHEIAAIRNNAPARIYDDSAPHLRLHNDVQAQDRHPWRLESVPATITPSQVQCRVLVEDLTGAPKFSDMRRLMKEQLSSIRSVVFTGGAASDVRLMSQFCDSSSLRCAGSVHMARFHTSVELAREVFAYSVRLHPTLATAATSGIARVMETHGEGQWEVGMIRGIVTQHRPQAPVGEDAGEDENGRPVASEQLPTKRTRREEDGGEEQAEEEDDAVRTLEPLPSSALTRASDDLSAKEIAIGSVFLGKFDLQKLGETAQQTMKVPVIQNRSAPVITIDQTTNVRVDENSRITHEAVLGERSFELRRAVYDNFAATL